VVEHVARYEHKDADEGEGGPECGVCEEGEQVREGEGEEDSEEGEGGGEEERFGIVCRAVDGESEGGVLVNKLRDELGLVLHGMEFVAQGVGRAVGFECGAVGRGEEVQDGSRG